MIMYSANLSGSIAVGLDDHSLGYGIYHKIDGQWVWQRNLKQEDDTRGQMPASQGHIAFFRTGENVTEIYVRAGEVYRTYTYRPIMTDGYRCGRWEGPERMLPYILDTFKKGVV